MKVIFEAMIKEIKNKSLVSGDKATRIVLEFDSNEKLDVLNSLNELHSADKFITVVIMDNESFKKEK